jgi:8-oxo-dGTP pyrophosphatase MutT (NUDIX family)
LEVFLIHPGGPYFAKKDKGAWAIPKGEYEKDEDPLAAAKRGFEEETGFAAAVHAWSNGLHIPGARLKSRRSTKDDGSGYLWHMARNDQRGQRSANCCEDIEGRQKVEGSPLQHWPRRAAYCRFGDQPAGIHRQLFDRFHQWLSALRKVEKRTTLRAEWTSDDGTVEKFFDYALKATIKNWTARVRGECWWGVTGDN